MGLEVEAYIYFGVELKKVTHHYSDEWADFRHVDFDDTVKKYFNTDEPILDIIDFGDISDIRYVLCLAYPHIVNVYESPTSFNPRDLHNFEAESELIINFCNRYNLEFEGDPTWGIVTYYG